MNNYTVLYADIVGFSRMLYENSEEALLTQVEEWARWCWDVVEQNHDGLLENWYGDGFKANWDASIRAVHCARELVENSKFPLKISISTGSGVRAYTGLVGKPASVGRKIIKAARRGDILVDIETLQLSTSQFEELLLSKASSIVSLPDGRRIPVWKINA